MNVPRLLVWALLLAPLAAQSPAGFEPLFDGESLAGWRGRPHLDPRKEAAFTAQERQAKQDAWNEDMRRHWRVEDGEIVNDGQGVFLTTERSFGDVEILLEYRTVPKADSGIYLRGCPQVQIWDWTEEGGKWNLGADKGSGALWNNQRFARFPSKRMDRPFGEWNRLRIAQVGARTWVWMNTELIVDGVVMENFFDRKLPLFARGPIQLQTHGGEIRFRELHAREIPPEEANRWLAEIDHGAFRPLFDGKTLKGWRGATDDYQVEDGAIVCKPGRGGNLHTEEVFSDFQVRFEFLLPPGGNNGLAIRYPGRGTPAFDGFCELQVLENTAAKYARLKPWQYHGSAYGLAPAHRGFLRPVGTWNYQEVTVEGAKVTVELNGFLILEADLGALEAAPDGREHPGLSLREGHFGFAGHSDPVRFRNVAIRPLD